MKNWFNCMVQFERIGYVENRDKIKGKITERESTAIMFGYSANSATGTYRKYNPDTKQVILTCDVKWHRFDGENTANDLTLLTLLKAH